MTVESCFETVERETSRKNVPRKIVPNQTTTSNKTVLQILCCQCVNLNIIGPVCVPSCLYWQLHHGRYYTTKLSRRRWIYALVEHSCQSYIKPFAKRLESYEKWLNLPYSGSYEVMPTMPLQHQHTSVIHIQRWVWYKTCKVEWSSCSRRFLQQRVNLKFLPQEVLVQLR